MIARAAAGPTQGRGGPHGAARHVVAALAMGSVLGVVAEETPRYIVLAKHASFEVRRYQAWAEVVTSCSGVVGDGGDGSFGRLAKFIGVFGKPQNAEGAKIAMTAPVLTWSDEPTSSAAAKMSFVLPSAVHAAGPPRPTDPSVAVREVPEKTVAAVRFSGFATRADVDAREKELREAVEKQADFTPTSAAPLLARYNPPWTPGFLRTNELLLPVEPAKK